TRFIALGRSEPARLRGLFGQAVAALRHDLFDQLGAIDHPTLVLTGDDDEIVPPENSQLLAQRIRNATLIILRGARHDFPTDRPAETAQAILAFLNPATPPTTQETRN